MMAIDVEDRPETHSDAPAKSKQDSPARQAVRFLTRGPTQVILVIVGLLWLLPTLGLLVSSFRTPGDHASTGWWTALGSPGQLILDNYTSLIGDPGLTNAFWNTVSITVPTTLAVVLVASCAGYAFAWIDFRGRDALFLTVIGLLVVPLQIGLIPMAQLFGRLGLFGSIPGVVLFHLGFGLPFAIFLMRNFFIGIPRDLMEAARVDGAGEATVFFKVVLPLGLPAIASLAIFQFLFVWNDLLVALVFASPANQPLTAFVLSETRQFGSNIDVIAPGAFLSMVVPLIVFFSFQRYFVQGMTAGSVK